MVGNRLLIDGLLRKGVNCKFPRKQFLLISQFLQSKNIKKVMLFSGLRRIKTARTSKSWALYNVDITRVKLSRNVHVSS